MNNFIWFNGKIIKWENAKIHIMTHSLHYASSVFEGLRSYKGKILKADEHFNRLHKSASYFDYKIPYSIKELKDATEQLILVNNLSKKDCYIRPIVWCENKTMTVSYSNFILNVAIGIWERKINYLDKKYINGINVNISHLKRPDPNVMPSHIKASGLYMISSISKYKSEKLGFDDALMLDYENNISEATSSNIFFTDGNKLYTPPIKCCLNGITRKICINILNSLKIPIEEKNFQLNDINDINEIFLTGTAIEILNIKSISDYNGNKIWNTRSNKISKLIHNKFNQIKYEL